MTSRGCPLLTSAALGAVLAAALLAASHSTLHFRAFTSEGLRQLRVAAAPIPVAPIDVVDARGGNRHLWGDDPDVRVWLVIFFYTRCPAICLAAGTEMQQLQAALGDDGHVRLASLSFDPARDSTAELAGYAHRFRADPARWLIAVPRTHVQLQQLLRETGVVAIDDGMGGISHNAAIHVISSTGRLVALFDLGQHQEALAFARGLPP